MTYKELTYTDLMITPSELYEQMGYKDHVPDEAVLAETERIVQEVSQFLRPRFCFFVTRAELSVEKEELVAAQRFAIGRIIARQLRGSEAYAFFICTAGMEYEEFQQRLMRQGDMVRVFIADALGSVIAEKCADQMEVALQQSVDKLGWKHTNRFSPGYCGWHVSEQQRLFPLFRPVPTVALSSAADARAEAESRQPAAVTDNERHAMATNPCGVMLTDSSLMVPIKSVSGIIGLGRQVRHLDYTCGLCDFKQCYKRKQKQRF